ncbi:metallophosphoesterase family protein [Clostridium sp. BJN0001]|uniref:purple acid phosphatase family protein n=1 Tax=Clostridium sp. BJN0001 TaxID=2930219 RepID=UPI001FD33DDF|nr:metallophosphoesterase family protein [Clostridium sp. BJN0001]
MNKKILCLTISFALSVAVMGTSKLCTKADAAENGVKYNSTYINENLNATESPDHIVLSFTEDPKTTQTITWRTISTDKEGRVEYRVKGTSTWSKNYDREPDVLTCGTGSSTILTGKQNIYSVTLKGLESGSTYEYRVVAVDKNNSEHVSKTNTFKTEEENNTDTKFIVFGDSQSGKPANPEYTPWHNTITEAYKENADADFVTNIGDLVEIGGNYQHWDNWFKAAEGVIDNIPEMPVQGNHETYSNNDFASAAPKDFKGQFSVPDNGLSSLIGQTYSYDYGNVHFVVLDSQEDEEAPSNDKFLEDQAEWLENDLKHNTQKWTIAMFHKTPYYNKKTRNNPAVKDILTPVLEKYHVDVVFNGHDHAISRTYAINDDDYTADFSNGTVYYVTGRSGDKYYTDLRDKVWNAHFVDCQDSPCYQVVDIDDGKLTIDSYKYNTIDISKANPKNVIYNTPQKVDSFTIDKDNPENSTKMQLRKTTNTSLSIAGTLQTNYGVTNSSNKGYIDPSSIAQYYGGTYDKNTLTLTVKDKSYKFNKEDLLKNDASKVCIDALYKQGIDVKYNKEINCVLVDFTSRITDEMISDFDGIKLNK